MSLPTASASRSCDQEGSSSSSPWSRLNLHSHNTGKVEDSDEDLFRVPDVEAQPPLDSKPAADAAAATTTTNTSNNNPEVQQHASSGKRRRGRNPVDRECRRLKRLLRNRVSAQQARERKKVYMNDLESRAKELEDRNSNLEEKISTLANENTMLRKVLMNTRPKADESSEPKHEQSSKS